MKNIGRRKFINTTAFAVAAPSFLSFTTENIENEAPSPAQQERKKDILIGIITDGDDPDKGFKKVQDLGFETCQLEVSKYSPEKAVEIKKAIKKYGIQPNALLVGGPGKMVWDFIQGPATVS